MRAVYLGSDHGGLGLKNRVAEFLKGKGYKVVDAGPYSYDKDDDFVDYAVKVCKAVKSSSARGILICKTGTGMTIAANKIPGIYAALCWNEESARLAVEHSRTNVLCMGALLVKPAAAERIAYTWLRTPYSRATRRQRRLAKVKKLEGRGR